MAKYALKTKKNAGSVSNYINSIEDEKLRTDGKALLKIFKDATGWKPKM